MLSRTGRLKLLLREFDWLNIKDFNKRKILQKTIYILQEMGIKFRYSYNWYIHGPYSPGLADDAYDIQDNPEYYKEEISSYRFKSEKIAVLKKFKELFKEYKEDEDKLELIGSLLFLRKSFNYDLRNLKEVEELKEHLSSRKGKFDSKCIDEAIDFIKDNYENLI